MKYPNIKIIFDRKKKSSALHEGTIEIRLTLNGVQKYISTGVKVLPKFWDEKQFVKGHPESVLLKNRITGLLDNINHYISALMLKNEPFSFPSLQAFISRKKLGDSFIDFVEKRKEDRTDITQSTKKNHNRLLNALKEFRIINTFSDLNQQNILEFDRLLHKKGYKQTTVYTYHKFMKVYINDAIKQNLIEKNPYINLQFEKGKSATRKYLDFEEFVKIRDCEIFSETISKVRDLFIFQCYTGLSYSDLSLFDPEKITNHNGRSVYMAKRKKTDEHFYIVIISEAMEILKKYNYKLPLITNQQYNLRLKTLSSVCDVKQDLTSHMARHTFAVNAINNGIPMEVVSKMLGHSNVNTTQIYAKIVNKTVEEAFDKIEQSLKK